MKGWDPLSRNCGTRMQQVSGQIALAAPCCKVSDKELPPVVEFVDQPAGMIYAPKDCSTFVSHFSHSSLPFFEAFAESPENDLISADIAGFICVQFHAGLKIRLHHLSGTFCLYAYAFSSFAKSYNSTEYHFINQHPNAQIFQL